jgi:hypothetical protein
VFSSFVYSRSCVLVYKVKIIGTFIINDSFIYSFHMFQCKDFYAAVAFHISVANGKTYE